MVQVARGDGGRADGSERRVLRPRDPGACPLRRGGRPSGSSVRRQPARHQRPQHSVLRRRSAAQHERRPPRDAMRHRSEAADTHRARNEDLGSARPTSRDTLRAASSRASPRAPIGGRGSDPTRQGATRRHGGSRPPHPDRRHPARGHDAARGCERRRDARIPGGHLSARDRRSGDARRRPRHLPRGHRRAPCTPHAVDPRRARAVGAAVRGSTRREPGRDDRRRGRNRSATRRSRSPPTSARQPHGQRDPSRTERDDHQGDRHDSRSSGVVRGL